MAAQKGNDVLLKIDMTGAGSFTTIGGQKSTGMTLNNEIVDVTTKGAVRWRELIEGAGIQSMSISLSGCFKDDAAEEMMRAKAFSAAFTAYELYFGNGDKFAGTFQIASYERTGEHNGEEIYATTFESTGVVTFTAGA